VFGISESSSGDSDGEAGEGQSSRRTPQKMLRIVQRSDASKDSFSRVCDRDGTLVSEGTPDKDKGGRGVRSHFEENENATRNEHAYGVRQARVTLFWVGTQAGARKMSSSPQYPV
jgi:hypothetical protein